MTIEASAQFPQAQQGARGKRASTSQGSHPGGQKRVKLTNSTGGASASASGNTTSGFRGARPSQLCAICLGRGGHDVRSCTKTKLWDGVTKAHCKRDDEGHVINPAGQIVCINFQRGRGCRQPGHLHECSGCGGEDHGAAKCTLVQKDTSADAA